MENYHIKEAIFVEYDTVYFQFLVSWFPNWFEAKFGRLENLRDG